MKNMCVTYVDTFMMKKSAIRITELKQEQNGKTFRKISSVRFAE